MYTIIGAIVGFAFVVLFYRSNMQLHLLGPSASLLDCLTVDRSRSLFLCADYGQFVLPLIFGTVAGGVLGSIIDRTLAKKKSHPVGPTHSDDAEAIAPTEATSDSRIEPVQLQPEHKEKSIEKSPRQLAVDDSPDGLLEKGLSLMQIAEGCSTDREYLQLMSKAYQQVRQAIEKGDNNWSGRINAEKLLSQIRGAVSNIHNRANIL